MSSKQTPTTGWNVGNIPLYLLNDFRTRRNLHSHNEKAPIATNLFQVSGYGEVSELCFLNMKKFFNFNPATAKVLPYHLPWPRDEKSRFIFETHERGLIIFWWVKHWKKRFVQLLLVVAFQSENLLSWFTSNTLEKDCISICVNESMFISVLFLEWWRRCEWYLENQCHKERRRERSNLHRKDHLPLDPS